MATLYEKHKTKSIKNVEKCINSMPPILSPTQLDNLKKHAYHSDGTSLLDPLFQPYWKWCVEKLPMNLAPNLITIIGLILNVLSSLLVMYYSPDGKNDVSFCLILILI
jgi:hypothetical protein